MAREKDLVQRSLTHGELLLLRIRKNQSQSRRKAVVHAGQQFGIDL
jgi:hypothetical protein